MEWNPNMDEAPRDGRRFIALLPSGRAVTAYNQAYYKKWPHEEGGPTYSHCWTVDNGDRLLPQSDITAWMPQPSPPED